jgi:HlyD family secretion protein
MKMDKKTSARWSYPERGRWILPVLLALAIVWLLTSCDGMQTTETISPDEVPVVPQDSEGKVIAEAVIKPARWSELRFDVAGEVVEVLTDEGDPIEAGAPLARLDTETLDLTLEEAQLALESAELKLTRAETERARQLAEAELTLQIAKDRLAQARARFPEPTAAEVALQQAIRDEADAAYEYEKAENRPWEWKYEHVQKSYTSAWQEAKDNLAVAQAEYDAAVAEQYASNQELAILEAEAQQARLKLERLQEGVDPLLAQEVEDARLQVAQAQVKLEAATLMAPFAGTVTDVEVEIGETVTAGEIAVVVATLDQLQAVTVDLVELDVARVEEGQAAVVTVDALPDMELKGRVVRVGLQSEEYRGDVTYPVTVALDEAAPGLRWGMTAMVEIETG